METSLSSAPPAPNPLEQVPWPLQGGRTGTPLQSRRAWLFAAIVLFLLQALPYLANRWVTDESWYAGPAYSIAQGSGLKDPAIGPNDIENHIDARPPGTALVIAGFFKLFGVGAISARLGSVLAGAGIVVLIFLLTKDILEPAAAILATLLIATDNLLVLTARTARPEALTVMMVLFSLLAIKHYKESGRPVFAFLSGLLLAGGAMFHVTLLGYIVSFFILLFAIGRERKARWITALLCYSGGFLAGIAPFAVWVLTAPRGREGFHAEFLSRAVQSSIFVRLLQEQRRYSDLIGLNMLHGHGLASVPVRLPIPLLFLVATFLLYRFGRRWFYVEMVLLVPSVLWLVYTVNKSSRYLALLAPLFAMTIGAAISMTRGKRTVHRAMIFAASLAVIAQAGANIYLLRAAKAANYTEVGKELRNLIPVHQTAYGTITLWLALHDRNYISYERTTPAMAADLYHARYFIVGDRMMVHPELLGEQGFYNSLSQQMKEIEARSDLAGDVVDPYYGDLKVYRLRQ